MIAEIRRGKSEQTQMPNVMFFKLGGTWDMVKRDARLIGSGGLDEEQLYELEKSLGYYNLKQKNFPKLEIELVKEVNKIILANSKKKLNLIGPLSWVPHIAENVVGFFSSLFSGDSSHLRPVLIAPLTSFMLHFANANPSVPILAAQGTDTADISLLPLLDAFLFDTNLLPVLVTGSNRSLTEWNSDAPKNFSDLIQLTKAHIPPGAYWVFAGHLYRASDVVKIDPSESRRIENYSTFFAPRMTARFTKKMIDENHIFHPHSGLPASENHPSQTVSPEKLYKALISVGIVDLGDQNATGEDIERIIDKNKKAVVVATHSLGNVSNPIRYACVQASLDGKIVVSVSRALIGEVNERYAASLLGANSKELLGKKRLILSGHKMNKNVAKAIVTRAVVENLNQHESQKLINSYCESRGLIS